MKNPKLGILFLCDDLDINEVIGCGQFIPVNKEMFTGNRMIVSKNSRRKGCFMAIF